MTDMHEESCPLCRRSDETLLWQDEQCRVIAAPQPGYPGFCRVIWHAHVREMSDLSAAQRARLMAVVWAVEEALRQTLNPIKINLASLGNQVPHLHWHVIPRFAVRHSVLAALACSPRWAKGASFTPLQRKTKPPR